VERPGPGNVRRPTRLSMPVRSARPILPVRPIFRPRWQRKTAGHDAICSGFFGPPHGRGRRGRTAAVPEFDCRFGFVAGARETLEDMKKRGAWRRHQDDAEYSALVTRALSLGFEQVQA
jgi:hypothetical protein